MKNALTSIQEILVLSLIFIIPFIFIPLFDYTFETPKIVVFYFFSILIGFGLCLKLLTGLKTIRLNIWIWIFFLFNLISFIFSIDKNVSLFGQYGYFTDGLIFLFYCGIVYTSILNLDISGNLKTSKKFLQKIIIAISLSVLIVSSIGIAEYLLNTHLKISLFRISSTFGQPNRLAQFLLPNFFLIFLSMPLFSKNILKIYLLFVSLLNFIAIVLTFSKSNYLMFLIFAVFSFYKFYKGSSKRNNFYYSFILFVVIISIILSLLIRLDNLFEKDPYNSLYLRSLEQQAAIKDWLGKDFFRKLFGTGQETVIYTYLPNKPILINQNQNEWFQDSIKIRSQYLQYLNTIGITGLFIFSILLIKSLRTKFLFSFKTAIFVIVSGYFFYYQNIPTVLYFWILLAIISKNSNCLLVKIPALNKKIKIIIYFILSIGIIWQINSLGRFILADYFSHSPVIDNQKKAVKLFPFLSIYKTKLAANLLNSALYFWDNKQPGLFSSEAIKSVSLYQNALEINPRSVRILRGLQWALYNLGSKSDKNFQLENLSISKKIVSLDPNNPLSWDSLGLCYLDLREYRLALDSFSKALEIKPDFIGSYLHLGEAFKQLNQLEKAKFFFEKALKLDNYNQYAIKELNEL